MNDTWFQSGYAGLDGAGVHLEQSILSVPWYNITFENPTAQNGAGMNMASSSLVLYNSLVTGNAASSYAGGIFAFYSGLTMYSSTIAGNRRAAAADTLLLQSSRMLTVHVAAQRRAWRGRREGLPSLPGCGQLHLCEQYLCRRRGAAV